MFFLLYPSIEKTLVNGNHDDGMVDFVKRSMIFKVDLCKSRTGHDVLILSVHLKFINSGSYLHVLILLVVISVNAFYPSVVVQTTL